MNDFLNIAAEYPWQMWFVFLIIAVAMTFYMVERVPLEITALMTIASLILFFHIWPLSGAGEDHYPNAAFFLSGLANPALITILALLVIGQGLFESEALGRPASLLIRLGRIHPYLSLLLALVFVFVISAFLNNTPVTVMFIPILAVLAQRTSSATGQVMMPLSFTCILGGMTTLIGSSTNFLAAQAAQTAGGPQVGFFSFTIPALMLAVPGLIYVMFVMPRMLPKHEGGIMDEAIASGGGRQYVAFIELSEGHELIGQRTIAGLITTIRDIALLMVKRGEKALLPPFEETKLEEGDTLIISASRETLTSHLQSRRDIFGVAGLEHAAGEDGSEATLDMMLGEVIVAPASRTIGRSLSQLAFRRETGLITLGVRRQSRMIRSMMHDIRLESGDVLLLFGPRSAFQTLGEMHDLLPLEWSASAKAPQGALRALVIFAGTILAAASGILPLVTATLLGATAMIAANVLNIRQAARSMDRRIILLVMSALAMAAGLESAGGAQFLARTATSFLDDATPALVLVWLFLIIAIATNILSNTATAVLFTPIAINTAFELNVPAEAFVVTVILASNCSFATPIGYQTNLLVMGPGRYRFRDYMRAGGPLILLLWVVYIFLIPRYYGF